MTNFMTIFFLKFPFNCCLSFRNEVTFSFTQDNFGDLEVRLEAKTEKETFTPVGDAGLGRASFSEFFSRYKTDNMYCVSEVRSFHVQFQEFCKLYSIVLLLSNAVQL